MYGMLPYNRKNCKGVSYTIFRPILDLIFCTFSRLLYPPFRVNMVTTKGKNPKITDALSRGRILPEANGYADTGY